MPTENVKDSNTHITNGRHHLSVARITALWALSEAALGGVLHAFRIPLTGLFINGSAIIFISLIAFYTRQKGAILSATFIVLLVKAGVSPHTPINAYLAVSLQGILGEFIFRWKRIFRFSVILFGLITMFLSSIQKIIVLTIVFGNNLWDSIDLFGNYVLGQIPFLNIEAGGYQVSTLLINLYIGIHLFSGLIIGIIAGNVPRWLKNAPESSIIDLTHMDFLRYSENKVKRKHKPWFHKPSGIAILILVSAIMILTYVYPQFSTTAGIKAIVMVVRSIFIMLIWYLVAGPFFLKMYKKYLHNRGNAYLKEVNNTINIFPVIKSIVLYSWNISKKYKNFQRIKYFMVTSILTILTAQIQENETD